MKLNIRRTLITGAIAGLLAGPAFAATDTSKVGVQPGVQSPAPTKVELGQPERDHPALGQPMNETPRMGSTSVGANGKLTTASNPLYTRSADDLNDVEVIDRMGDKVGDVKQIVLAPDRRSASAVISTGGILGMGAHDIMISLDDLALIGDKLQMSATKAEATAQKDEAPGADKYVEVKGDTPISGSIVEFSAFEQGKEANKPGAAPMTPKDAADKPETVPATPRAPQ